MSEAQKTEGGEGRQFVVAEDDDGIRLDRWFKRHMPDTSFNIVSRWARTGQLRVDGRRAAPGDRIEAGQTIRVPPAEVAAAATAAANAAKAKRPERPREPLTPDEIAFAQSLVIHRDRQAIVINKPPGLATQGGTKTEMHDPRPQRAALVLRLAHGLRELDTVRQMRRHQTPNPKREWVRARSIPRSSARPFRRPMAG